MRALREAGRDRAEARVRGWLRRRGLALVSYSPEEYVHLRRVRVLAAHGVDVVLDVGANAGQYAGHLRREGYRGRIVSFEPVLGSYEQLREAARRDPGWEARHTAVGDTAGTLEVHLYADSLHNS